MGSTTVVGIADFGCMFILVVVVCVSFVVINAGGAAVAIGMVIVVAIILTVTVVMVVVQFLLSQLSLIGAALVAEVREGEALDAWRSCINLICKVSNLDKNAVMVPCSSFAGDSQVLPQSLLSQSLVAWLLWWQSFVLHSLLLQPEVLLSSFV